MKKNIFIIFIFLSVHISHGQSTTCLSGFEQVSGNYCDLNVNTPSWSFGQFNDTKRAVAKVVFHVSNSNKESYCTGTLINQAISENEIHQYVLLADHCINGNDITQKVKFMFHYESPNSKTNATAETNRGCLNKQSIHPIAGISNPSDGYEYFHESFVREVKRGSWGDYAMIEILTPIPAQYNIYYAGWEPKEPLGGNASNFGNAPYLVFHHPEGDIKKVARTLNIQFNSNPINQGCNAIGGTIDNLIGTIGQLFGGSGASNVSQVCNYTGLPFYSINVWENGSTAKKSSGSSLLNIRGHIMGELSFGPSSCEKVNGDQFGKFAIAYNTPEIKNALNPSNQLEVNNFGLDGRARNCYTGNMEVTGQYFPHNHYQNTNHIDINVQGNISNASNNVYVHSGSDYTYNAGGNIVLNAGFQTDLNVNFAMNPNTSPCTTSNRRVQSEESKKQTLIMNIRSMELPQGDKHFNTAEYIDNSNDLRVELNPNPAHEQVLVKAYTDELFSVAIQTASGEQVWNIDRQQGELLIPVDHFVSGVYLLRVSTSNKSVVRKLVVQ